MARNKITENDIAKVVIQYLEKLGYQTYKEVTWNGGGSHRADIVGYQDSEFLIVETKTTFGLKVIEQAMFYKDKAHKVYICIPRANYKRRWFGYQICRDYGIGILEVYYFGKGDKREMVVFEHTPSTICQKPNLPTLYEEQKNQNAGTKESYVTPFKMTVKRLINHVKEHGPDSLEHALMEINHHYKNVKSGKSALTKLIKGGAISELEIVNIKGRNFIYLTGHPIPKSILPTPNNVFVD